MTRRRKIFLSLEVFLFFLVFTFSFLLPSSLSADSTVTITAEVSPSCGNGAAEEGEQCDGSDLEGQTCTSRGYSSGTLSCSAGCTFNTSGCTSGGGGGSTGGGGGGGGYTPPPSVTRVILQGKAYPGAKITILIDAKVATIISADSGAGFKTELFSVKEGVYNFGLWAGDKKGRKSITFSFTAAVTQDKTTTISNIFLPPTIDLERVNLAKGEDLNISGQTAPKSEISISVESEEEIIKMTTAKDDGDWQYLFETDRLEEGSHTVRAKAETQDGLESSYSKVLSFGVGKYSSLEICPKADFNKDKKTSLVDFSILLYWWGKYNACVDQNQDGMVNLADFSILMYWWTG